MYKTIIPGLVTLETALNKIPGAYLFQKFGFFPPSKRKAKFHYRVLLQSFEPETALEFRSGYYMLSEDAWYYNRKLFWIKFTMKYVPETKTFYVSKLYLLIPMRIGGIIPFGKHFCDMINLDLTLSGFTLMRGCAFKVDHRVTALVWPSLNGKTSIIAKQIKKGALYIAEDILVIDARNLYLYPTAALPNNYGRVINKKLYGIAKENALLRRQKLSSLKFLELPNEIPSKRSLKRLQNYYLLNSLLFMDNGFIMAYVAANNLGEKVFKLQRLLDLRHVTSQVSPIKIKSQENADHWQSYGSGYTKTWESPGKQIMSSRELEFVSKACIDRVPKKLLDVGVGTGRIIEKLVHDLPNTDIYGIDVAPSMVRATKKRLRGIKRLKGLEVCDISKKSVPFRSKFDAITSVRVIKYNQNWQDIIAKLAKTLSLNGILVFSMTNRNSINRFGKYHIDFERTTPGELRQLASKLGLEVIDMRTFTRLPDVLYDINHSKLYGKLLGMAEQAFDIIGPVFLGREIFVSMRKAQ